jgi:cell pole-organizing protein PopZ
MAADKDLDDILASIRKIVVETPAIEIDDVRFDSAPEQPVAMPDPSPLLLTTPADPAPAMPTPAAAASDAPTLESPTLESTVRAMLEPMLKAWLDANLPRIVSDAVDAATSAEIRRLTGRD